MPPAKSAHMPAERLAKRVSVQTRDDQPSCSNGQNVRKDDRRELKYDRRVIGADEFQDRLLVSEIQALRRYIRKKKNGGNEDDK